MAFDLTTLKKAFIFLPAYALYMITTFRVFSSPVQLRLPTMLTKKDREFKKQH